MVVVSQFIYHFPLVCFILIAFVVAPYLVACANCIAFNCIPKVFWDLHSYSSYSVLTLFWSYFIQFISFHPITWVPLCCISSAFRFVYKQCQAMVVPWYSCVWMVVLQNLFLISTISCVLWSTSGCWVIFIFPPFDRDPLNHTFRSDGGDLFLTTFSVPPWSDDQNRFLSVIGAVWDVILSFGKYRTARFDISTDIQLLNRAFR